VLLKLLGYAPDADPTVLGVLTSCSGVVPSLKGMKGAPTPADTPLASLGETCIGAVLAAKRDGTTRLFAGSRTALYEAGVSTWASVGRSATYTAGTTARWRWAQYDDATLAANGADTIQASVSSGPFSCIASAPVANIVETVGAFAFALNLSATPNGWHCSANGNYASWSPSIATQAATGTLSATPGAITAGRRFGSAIVAYKKNSMYLGVNVGPPNIWEFSLIPGEAGAMSQEAVVNIGTPENPKHIFMGEDDFYVFDGSRALPIGNARVKETVYGALLQSRYYACMSLHDRANSRVYFYYPVSDSIFPDKCVVYNYRTDRWGVDDRQIEAAADYATPGITYATLGSFYATYDALPALSYDLAFQNDSQAQPAIFDLEHKLKTLTGPAGTTSFTTGDYGDDARFFLVNRVRPRFLTKPSAATWTPAYRNNLGDALTTDTSVALSSDGAFDFLRDARWHRGTMEMVGDWEMAVVNAEGRVSGLE
jgi:hypothetical protein